MPTEAAFATLVTLVVGVITSAIASVTLITTKENRISEFRQAWIDNQRADLAIAIATANSYFHIRDVERRAVCLNDFFAARTRIALRDKPQDSEWTKTLVALDKLGKIMMGGVPNTFELLQATAFVTNESRVPLKMHWQTVKSGERFYRCFKVTFVAALSVSTIGIIGLFAFGQPLTANEVEKVASVSLTLNVR
ncbi:hypothetical protein [Sphingomonas faeni]|uniref:hypothetical protein n=1 Tax=Sphingomonas faeni TaxID=185950 RepID=UPI00334BC427